MVCGGVEHPGRKEEVEDIMNTKTALIVAGGLVVAALLYSLALYSRLPDPMPCHWNIRGEVDGYCSKPVGTLLMPGFMALMLGGLLGLPLLTLRNMSVRSFLPTFNYLMVICQALMGYIHVVLLQAALNTALDLNKALMGGIFFFLALIGNVMGKLRRNPWAGVRTPWTLSSDEVWIATHRFAAHLWTWVGLLCSALIWLSAPLAPVLCIGIPLLLLPIPYSYIVYKRTGGRG
jgi:uncharacterized membrane protein